MNVFGLFLAFVLSFSVQVMARERTLVIVQVEDTLKLSHVQNFWDSLNYNTDTKQRFIGMNAALSELARKNAASTFAYLTQGPEMAAGEAEMEFISVNGFPRGQFVPYSNNADRDTQMKVLRKLIKTSNPARVILMSHNGGLDPEIFHGIAMEFKDIYFLQYLHVIYSITSPTEMGSSLFLEQTGFVTAVELLVDWQLKGLVGLKETITLAQLLIPKIVYENLDSPGIVEYGVPRFVNCDDFQWKWVAKNDYSFLVSLRDHLIERCHMQISPLGSPAH
ncbi:MAG TPA: phosphatase domain-containing protein [Pseudobdellovibrionaceae bacterium]